MIKFERYKLENGLTVILHQDMSTPLVAVNVLYKVGSKNEDPDKTGFAHLFEHLMFGGSVNVPDFDTPIQDAGGENNAFTNSDLTNFYNIMPKENLETALWLESDRMLQLDFSQKALDIQKKVVVEEFNETCINQPFGDLWHELSDLSFKIHPYRWPTIGIEPGHIENASLNDVESFFHDFYQASNAVLVLAGNFESGHAKALVEKWFGNIPSKPTNKKSIPTEPGQEAFRTKSVNRDVPSDALFMAFHMPDRLHKDFPVFDLISDVFSGGRSGRFYQRLLKGSSLFSSVNAYLTGSMDPGLFIIESKLIGKNKKEEARSLIWRELELLCSEHILEEELQKVKNGIISSIEFSEVSIIHKAINLAYFEMLGDATMINRQDEGYKVVDLDDIQRQAQNTFIESNCSELFYESQ